VIIKHFSVKTPDVTPPESDGWEQGWYGYHQMQKCETEQRKIEYTSQDRDTKAQGMITEADFERDVFLSILADIKKEKVNMFELGAGWGRMCLALAGPLTIKSSP
jgi:hypothetical protein